MPQRGRAGLARAAVQFPNLGSRSACNPRRHRRWYARSMGRSVIVSAVRTPFGKLGGSLANKQATELGSLAIRSALDRAGIENDEVEYVIMGQVLQGGAGQAPSRQASIGAGLPIEIGSDTINKVCASSVRAVQMADQMIRAGDHDVIVAGGMESMSNAPYVLKKARFGYKLGDGTLIDLMTHDGLTSTFDRRHMVEQASFVSRELGISREEQDLWALRSHDRAVRAIDEGRFDSEIVPAGEVEVDEGPRRDTSIEKLAQLKPVFDPEGTTTAGNAPGVNDGAGALVVTSEEFASRRGLEVLATIVAQGYVADEFAYLARTPAKAGAIALGKAGKTIDDVERVELNEAFSSVVLNSTKLLGADPEKVNVNGGAVALGHPIGASGARILATMIHELRRNGGGRGLAAARLALRRGSGRGRARPRDDAQEPDEARREGRGRPRRGAGARRGGRRPGRGRPDGRGRRRGRGGQGGRLPPRRRDPAARGGARFEHLLDPDQHPGRRDLATGARDRHALLQPGAGADARRGRARARDLRRDGRGDHGARGRARQDAGGRERLSRLRLEPDPDAVHQRGRLG